MQLKATAKLYTISLHDALPISWRSSVRACGYWASLSVTLRPGHWSLLAPVARTQCDRKRRSEEHTSELQSLAYLVYRLLLEIKQLHIKRTAVERENEWH